MVNKPSVFEFLRFDCIVFKTRIIVKGQKCSQTEKILSLKINAKREMGSSLIKKEPLIGSQETFASRDEK